MSRIPDIYTPEQKRQILEGRSMARAEGVAVVNDGIGRNKITGSRLKPAPKPNAPKGHEALLKALETSGASIEVDLRDDPKTVVGVVKRSDAYTISLEVERIDGTKRTRVLFKHAMIGFSPLTPRPTKEDDAKLEG